MKLSHDRNLFCAAYIYRHQTFNQCKQWIDSRSPDLF